MLSAIDAVKFAAYLQVVAVTRYTETAQLIALHSDVQGEPSRRLPPHHIVAAVGGFVLLQRRFQQCCRLQHVQFDVRHLNAKQKISPVTPSTLLSSVLNYPITCVDVDAIPPPQQTD